MKKQFEPSEMKIYHFFSETPVAAGLLTSFVDGSDDAEFDMEDMGK